MYDESVRPPTPNSANAAPGRITSRSYLNGPGGAVTLGDDQVNAGGPAAVPGKGGVTARSLGGSGARGMTPLGKVAAAATSGRPQPRIESGVSRLVAAPRSAWRKASGPSDGWSCFTSAAAAAVI